MNDDWELPGETEALAHASRGGHVCGREASMRVFAVTAARQTNADEVFVTPEHTFVLNDGEIVRWVNSPEIREALDRYLLTGEVPSAGSSFRLVPPGGAS